MNGHPLDAGGHRFAIVGMGCRLPGSANDHRAFWDNLVAGKRCVIDAPASRYDAATLVSRDPSKPGRRVGGRGGYIDGLDEFDPGFFGIGAHEAEAMDPQQRKLLEVAWEALEDAGLRPAELAGRDVGVFIGASSVDYQILQFADPSFEQLSEHTATGSLLTMVAGRIAHCFDLRGPSMAVDTAGSSSLVAVHLACRSLAAGETSLALAGGVALDLAPQYAIAQTRRGWLSPDGESRPFDAGANGWVRAEAAAVIVLKRLAEALRDGDPIHAVIAGSGVSGDGRGAGLAVPGGDAEVALVRRVCQGAGVSPGALHYVEAHGASTPIGDPIEASALGAALADGREPGGRCLVGSVSGNLGHAGAAAGIAGLIKVALTLGHKQIPPHLGLERIHPAIDLARLAIEIPTRLIAWPPHVRPACAGVHSLGIGGTHALVVMQEPPPDRRPASHARPGYNLLPLTARDPAVFRTMVAALARELHGDHGPTPAVADVGYTLARRRQHLEARLSFVYSSPADLAEVLAHYLAGEASPRIVTGSRVDERRRRLAWVFTGAGHEWWAMGRELFAGEPVYRDAIERCDRAIARIAGWSLIDELAADEAASNMAEPCLAGPATFALQVGLAALWRSLGARPDAIVGHGAGELAAFHEAGVYNLEDAIQIAIHRSRVMHALAGSGAMLAVGLSEAAAEARIAAVAGRVAIAAIDGPSSVALSGERDALDALRAELAAEQVAAQWLPVAIPYHSPAMDRIRDELLASLADLRPRPAALPLYLTAAEGTAGGPELDAAYWWRNVRDPVRFRAAIDRMIDAGCGVFLELGPHPGLGGAIADCLAARGADGRVLPSIRRGEHEPRQVMASLAALHAAGLDIAWDELYPVGRTVPLPGYPWKRDRCWTEPAAIAQVRLGQRDHELLGRRLPTIEPVWDARIDVEQLSYLADPRPGGRAVFPAAGYLAMAAEAVRVLSPGRCVALGEIELGAPLVLDGRTPAAVQLAIGAEAATLRIASPAGAGRDAVVHATAAVRVGPPRRLGLPLDLAERRARAEVHRDAEACYAALAELGHDPGPAFRAIEEIWVSPGEALARVRAPASLGGTAARYHAHPCLLDACLQTLQCPDSLVGAARSGGAVTRVPRAIAEVRICEVGDRPLWVHATITARSAGETLGDIAIYGESGEPLGALTGVRMASAEPAAAAQPASRAGLFEVSWVELPALPDGGPVAVAPGEPWILLADAHGLGAALARQIEAGGAQAWLVRPGPRSALDREQRAVTIDPGSATDAGALFAAIAQRSEGRRCRVVHLWSLDAPALAGTSAAQLRNAAAHATYSLVVIAQALLASELAGELSIVTRGTQAVIPGAGVEPAGAPAWGLGRALRDHELIGWRGKLIDLEPVVRSDDAAVLARELATAGDDELALRGGRRFTPRLGPATGPAGSLPVRLRPDGTYLVIGAFGALGRRVCRLLVQRGARRLIAMSRSKLPPRVAWHALDASPDLSAGVDLGLDGPAGERVRFVQELEALGAEVIAAPVDITDETALAGWLAGFRALRYPPIRGVFHATGPTGGAPLAVIDADGFRAVHDPKVIGAYLVHKHTADEPLDHFAVFSSLAPLLSAAGQAPAAAGNAFLDALAHHRRAAGLPALSVSWEPCADAAITAADPRLDRLIDRVLGEDRAQVAVAAVDWRAFVARAPAVPRLLAGVIEDAGARGPGPAAVDVLADETCFPLSQNQQALWIVNQLDPDTVPYHLGDAVEIHARLDPELVFAAVRILIRRHAMLRARIAVRDGRPVHRIARDVTADVKRIDVRGWTWADVHAALLREYRKPFDLEREPLLRFRLFQRGDRRFVALQVVHRIIADAGSTAMFLDELLAVYDALRRGVDPVLPPLPARYLDFVNWQNRLLTSPEATRMLRYWIEHLPAELPALPLPTDRPRPDVQTHHGASQSFVLGSDLTARIQAMAQVTGATPSAILLAAYCLLLHRYTGQDDIIVGSPVAGRMQDAHAAIYGSFANALPLHVSLAGDPAFLAVLERVRATVAGALEHQDYPFARLVEQLGLPHDPGRSPVFQVMFELLDRATTERRGIKLDRIELPEQAGPLDLTLSVREDEPEHALRCTLTYNRDLFDAETIRRMASHYTRLVVAAIADPLRPISELEMLGSAERARIVQRWSGADVAVVPDRPVHAMIRRHAALRPDSLAVIAPSGDGARIVTYGELDAAAAQLARRLRELGAGDGDVVAVCLDRSPELAIALLGILHTGAAYLAVDPEDSDAHIAAQIERAGARFLVGAIAGRLTGLVGCTRLSFEDALGDPGEPAAPDPAPVAGAAGLDRTACVFQASGSPGQPRVIAISHRSLASAYHAWDVTYRLRSEARVHLQTARTALDRFTGALVRALCSGGALCLVGEPLVGDLARLYDTLVHHAVDTAELTPALARDLTVHCLREGKRLEFLRLVVVGPGAWTVDDDQQLRALLERRSRLVHVYGAAEATIDSAYFEGPADGLPPDRQVPIGGPFPASRVFVLDRHGAPVPVGVPGELWLGGNGVAAGYLGEPDATAARFKTVELDERGLMRLYRTGDLARWDTRGMLHAVATAAPDAGAAIPPPARKG